jgi:hypothetical protein
MTTTADTRRELDHRSFDAISVTLAWDTVTDRAVVTVADARTDDAFEIEVRSDERALDVFRHPYAYAAHRRSGTQPERRSSHEQEGAGARP